MTDNNTPQTFSFAPGMNLRTITKDGEPWFVAADSCAVLGLTTSNLRRGLDAAQIKTLNLNGMRGRPAMLITEAGLYTLILRSSKPEAKAFRKWVTSTVLPTLRKDGLYIAGQEKSISDALTLPELLEQLATVQAKVDALKETQIRAWSRHQEEREARDDGFRVMRGKAPLKRVPMAPPPSHLTARLVITKPAPPPVSSR